ncbi:MAG: DUF3772 domain-containing protein, partial [Pseudomonadota bacterium]
MRLPSVRHAIALVLFVFWSGVAIAQATAPDYAQWQSVASRAEEAVERAQASDTAFDTLRAEVAQWRAQFQTQLNANDSRLQTLRDQIDALGPAPGEGETEADEIAARRAELSAQLERLSTPRRTAEEAFSRANGIITEIDEILRQRQADELLNMGPWPINPTLWSDALRHARESLVAVTSGTTAAWHNPVRRAHAQDNLPLVIVLTAVGLVLLIRSRYWSEFLAVRIQRGDARSRAGVAGFFVSLGQIVLPMLGLFAINRAIAATQLYGPRGQLLLDLLEPIGLTLFFSAWLASRFFPRNDALRSPLTLPVERRVEGGILTVILGATLAAYILL